MHGVRVAASPQTTQMAVSLSTRLSQREEQWHRAEGLTAEVEIQAGADDASPLPDEAPRDVDDGGVEELHLVDGDDGGVLGQPFEDRRR